MKAKAKWTLGGVTLMAIIVVSTLLFGIIPISDSIRSLAHSTTLTQRQNLTRMHYLQILRNRAKYKDHFYASVAHQRNLMPPSLDVVELVNGLGVTASRTGVDVVSFSISLPQPFTVPASVTHTADFANAASQVPVEKLKVSTVTLGVSGSFSQIQGFLNQLDHSSRFVMVSHASIQPSATNTSATKSGVMVATLSAEVFTFNG